MRYIFDTTSAAIGLLVLSPLFALIALAIKLEGGGPVFYRQVRVGKGFRTFQLLKFRSMIAGADQNGLLTAPQDMRITRVGYWLRRWKLDELPQLINVVQGDMQLVGSRPEVPRYVDLFKDQYAMILHDRPGITDPASLAYRNEEEALRGGNVEQLYLSRVLPQKLELSVQHAKSRTFVGDLGIIFRTLLSLGAPGVGAGHESKVPGSGGGASTHVGSAP
jgi:lipopolysaccharide/colanic/teichoic acid biosynthesis glycosyltransferase